MIRICMLTDVAVEQLTSQLKSADQNNIFIYIIHIIIHMYYIYTYI